MVIMDSRTKYPEAGALRSKKAEEVTAFVFATIVARYPVKEFIHDNGGEFAGEFAQMGGDLGIKMQSTSTYRPQSNGLVERFNSTLKQGLYRLSEKYPESWPFHLPRVLRSYRATPHESTQLAPARVMIGCTFPELNMAALTWSTFTRTPTAEEEAMPRERGWLGAKVSKLFFDPDSKHVKFFDGKVIDMRLPHRGQEEYNIRYEDGDSETLDVDDMLPW